MRTAAPTPAKPVMRRVIVAGSGTAEGAAAVPGVKVSVSMAAPKLRRKPVGPTGVNTKLRMPATEKLICAFGSLAIPFLVPSKRPFASKIEAL